jgi:chromosome segregation and condensation protein ScpB
MLSPGVTFCAPDVTTSIERHLGNPRPVALSRAALEVLAIIAYKQPSRGRHRAHARLG